MRALQRYSEAERAMEQVLKLDKDCEEAVNDLFNCKVLQLMVNTPKNQAAKVFPVSSVTANENELSFHSFFYKQHFVIKLVILI